jgi:hypothetical protein
MIIKIAAGTALVALTLALTGCGEKCPSYVETNYLNACQLYGGAASSCACALNWYEDHVSFVQFKADEDDVRTGTIPDNLRYAAQACAGS